MAMCGLYVRRSCPRCSHKAKEVVQASLVLTREEVKNISQPVAPTVLCMMCGKDAGITHGAVPNGTSFANGTATGPPFHDGTRKWHPMYFVNAKGEAMPDFNRQGLLRVANDRMENLPRGLQKCIESPPHWPEGKDLAGPFAVDTRPGMPTRAPPLVIAEAEVAEDEVKLAQPAGTRTMQQLTTPSVPPAPLPEPALEPWDGEGWEPWSHVARRLQAQERTAA